MAGKATRDLKYRKLITQHVALKADHPIHAGVEMQAHHLISAKGVEMSSTGKWLEKVGYDINLLPNLVLIPSTLQGACHLGVQPHKSGHTVLSDPDDPDHDDAHPMSYHTIVAMELRKVHLEIKSICFGNDKDALNKLTEKMNQLSKKILNKIQMSPGSMRLSAVADYYQPSLAGCGGMDNIPPRPRGQGHETVDYTEKHICTVSRNHQMAQDEKQRKENIKLPKPMPFYKLSTGN